jgi:hypothetical protein
MATVIVRLGRLKAVAVGKALTAILFVPFHRVPPPKESMKEFLENRRLK